MKRTIAGFLLVVLLVFHFSLPDRTGAGDMPFLGEMRWVAFDFAPRGWAFCDGQLLPISANTALFYLLGTTYGGNGTTTFALPDMRGRAPIHAGQGPGLSNRTLAETGGTELHTLMVAEIPAHAHALKADPREGKSQSPTGNVPAKTSTGAAAYGGGATAHMAPLALAIDGGSQPHENRKPFITLKCIINLDGISPSRN